MSRFHIKFDPMIGLTQKHGPTQNMTDGRITIQCKNSSGLNCITLMEGGFEGSVGLSHPDTLLLLTVICRATGIKPEDIKP